MQTSGDRVTATVSSAHWNVDVVDRSSADLWRWRLGQYLGQTSNDGGWKQVHGW